MKHRFTEAQIIKVLKEAESGGKVSELCRKHGISDATYYNWKAKFGGMTVSDAQRLKALESENGKLKRLLAESLLDLWADRYFTFVVSLRIEAGGRCAIEKSTHGAGRTKASLRLSAPARPVAA